MINVYKVIPDQSTAHFTLLNSIIPDINGEFSCLSGMFAYDAEYLEKSSIEAFIDVKTIDTGNGIRDEELKSDKVFNVKLFPTIKFVSRTFRDNGKGILEVTGDLTVKTVTRKAMLEVEKPDKDKEKIMITANTVVNREAFKLELGSILEIAEILVGDDIHFDMDIQLIKQ